jgi:hypothetical protein
MTEKIEHELLSRRKAFSLFGMTAAFGLALPVTLSALSDAEAQTGEWIVAKTDAKGVTSGVTTGAKDATPVVTHGVVAEASPRVREAVPAQSSAIRRTQFNRAL